MSIQKNKSLNIDFVTLSRSDYASIQPIILESLNYKTINTGVITGGSHQLKRFGSSIDIVKKDLPVDEVVNYIDDNDNSYIDFGWSYSKAVSEFIRVLSARQPDMVFIVGDRWELLAVATAANMLRIPIIHHSGGDITQGSADNQTRYAVTNLAHVHYVSLDEHAKRLIKTGEEEWRIKVTGEPALSQLATYKSNDTDFYKRLAIQENESFVLATFHPTTYDDISFQDQVEVYISALSSLDMTTILTSPNPDPGSKEFYDALSSFADSHDNIHMFSHLGVSTFYNAMAKTKFMIGNSSSGLWEAPSFKCPVVNIGRRQEGRTKFSNVIDAELNIESITRAVRKVSDPKFKAGLSNDNPYVKNNTITYILNDILNLPGKEVLLTKRFIDPLQNS